MRLTQVHREAFVRGVMADVPGSDDLHREAEKIIHEDMRAKLPPQIVALMNNAKLKGYLAWNHYSPFATNRNGRNCYMASISVISDYRPAGAVLEKITKLVIEDAERQQERMQMRNKLKIAIKGCKTVKQAQELFPELAKYLPTGDEQQTDSLLPATANVVADLAKLGWPRGKVPQ